MTDFIWAPTGAFLILLMCVSLSVSFENFTGGVGAFAGAEEMFAGDVFWWQGVLEGAARVAMLVRVDCTFSCCCLNLLRLSCNAICEAYVWKKFFKCEDASEEKVNSFKALGKKEITFTIKLNENIDWQKLKINYFIQTINIRAKIWFFFLLKNNL